MGHYDVGQGKYVEDAPDAAVEDAYRPNDTPPHDEPAFVAGDPVGSPPIPGLEFPSAGPTVDVAMKPITPAPTPASAEPSMLDNLGRRASKIGDALGTAVGSVSPIAGLAITGLNSALTSETPPESGPSAAAQAASSVAPAAAATEPPPAPAAPEAPPPPEVKTVSKSPEITKHLTNKAELAADREVNAAVAEGAAAIKAENNVRTKQAEVDQAKLDIEATQKKAESARAKTAFEEGVRRKSEIDSQAKQDEATYRQAAAEGQKGFWGTQDIQKKKAWSLSLMFGAFAVAFGEDENPGRKLLDKAMADWTTERDKNLTRLEKQAEKSTGLQRTFWKEYGEEYKNRKELQDAAAYNSVADQIDKMNLKMRALIPESAAAANAKASAEYRQKAADKTQAVVEKRFANDQVRSGGTETTVITGKPAAAGAGQGRAATAAFNAARIAEHAGKAIKDREKLLSEGVTLDESDLIRIQENKKEIEAGKHEGLLEGKTKRFLHIEARTPFDGLNEKKRALAQANEVLMQKAAVLAAGGSTAEEAINHARGLFDLFQPGQGDEGVNQKMEQIQGIVGANRALGGTFSKVAQKGADESEAAARNRAKAPAGVRQTRRLKSGATVTGTLLADGNFQLD